MDIDIRNKAEGIGLILIIGNLAGIIARVKVKPYFIHQYHLFAIDMHACGL